MRRAGSLLAAAAALAALLWGWSARRGATRDVTAVPDAARRIDVAAGNRAPPERVAGSEPEPEPEARAELPAEPAGLDEAALPGLDLERLRERLPEHSYWTMLAPTEDRALVARREAHARRLNVLYGRVLSGTGTAEEIAEYFEERRRISEEAIAFASAVIVELGDELGERERALLDLAITLHQQRLAELPRRIAEAEQRKRVQDARREEWMRTGR